MVGGFYATSGRTIGLDNETSAFVYSVLGATRRTDKKGVTWRFATECVGFDEIGGEHGTEGVGRCTWSDAENDKLFVNVSTVGQGNRYEIRGRYG